METSVICVTEMDTDNCQREEIKAGGILEAGCVYLIMREGCHVSLSSRTEWLLEHLNKTVSIEETQTEEQELIVRSIVPYEPPPNCNYEASHYYKYLITQQSKVVFLSHKYRIVYCLDMSPSLSAVDIQRGEVMIDEMFVSLKHSLEGLTKPCCIPGSSVEFRPQIYVTVIAHTPFFTTPAQQVLVQGWEITEENLEIFLKTVQQQLLELENIVAEVAGIAYERVETIRAESEKLVGGLFEETSEMMQPPTAHIPMVSPDLGFINMLRYAILALRLLPDSNSSNIVILTDGIIAVPDAHVFDSLMNQLRTNTIQCSFLHVGSLFHPECCTGMVPDVDIMKFIAEATHGVCMNNVSDYEINAAACMNVYHNAFLTWSFYTTFPSVPSNYHSSHGNVLIWNTRPYSFRGTEEPQLLRKNQMEDNLNLSLSAIICCRQKEGFSIRAINICESHLEIHLVLPWKNYIYLEYVLTTQWPISPVTSTPIHYRINIEAPYEFLHDVTCLVKKEFKSPYRQAVVSRFWATFKSLGVSDQILVHLNTFLSNSTAYVVPESIRSGMPVFYLPPNSCSPSLTSSDMTSPQFWQYWRQIVLMDPNSWQKWLYTRTVSLILQHDHPLPKHLHLANTSGRFQVIQCRQAAAALYALLKDWSTFVLIENQAYVKLIPGDLEKPPQSFVALKVASKAPCVVLHLAFLEGTPSMIRQQIVGQLRDQVAHLTFPQRPSTKDVLPRKVSVTQNLQQHSPVTRTWSEIKCCSLLRKPVEKILIRYERVPPDFSTVVFPDGTQPATSGKQLLYNMAGANAGGLLTTLSRYLHHRRWLWSTQSGPNSSIGIPAIARILSTITKMRLQEGFTFAHSSAGIINMVLEVEMKLPSIKDKDEDDEDCIQPCVIQYVLFPPHTTSMSNKESNSEEGTEEIITDADADTEGELQIIAECWIEPQHGVVINSPPERSYMNNLPYHKLADAICSVDYECISCLLTFEHLSLMCKGDQVSSPTRSLADGQTVNNPYQRVMDYLKNCDSSEIQAATFFEERINHIPFPFNLMHVLPKCQQAELLLSTFIQDLSGNAYMEKRNSSSSSTLPEDGPNNLLLDALYEHLKKLHNKELNLSDDDCAKFQQLLIARQREGSTYPLPVPCSDADDSDGIPIPKWRCFLKGISVTHVMLTFVPATYTDLKNLMLSGDIWMTKDTLAVNIWNDVDENLHLELASISNSEQRVNEKGAIYSSLDRLSSLVDIPQKVAGGSSVTATTPASSLSRRSSCDASQIHGNIAHLKLQASGESSCDFLNETPFRIRASSLDAVTKRTVRDIPYKLFLKTGSLTEDLAATDDSVLRNKHSGGENSSSSKMGVSYQHKTLLHKADEIPLLKRKPSSNSTSEKNQSSAEERKPVYGSVTLPVYMYDCSLSVLMEALVYKDSANKAVKDIYDDQRRKVEAELTSEYLPNCEFDIKSKKTDETGYKHSNSESKSEDSDSTLDKPTLKQHCKLISLAFYRCYVYTVFKSLRQSYVMHGADIQAAVAECEENLIEINITSFLMTACGHLKDIQANSQKDVNVVEIISNTDSDEKKQPKPDALCDTNKDETSAEQLQEATETLKLERRIDNVLMLPLSKLQESAICKELKQLHNMIKQKFKNILRVYFKPVPSHQEYYFCDPDWEKIHMDMGSYDIEIEGEIRKTETGDAADIETFNSELVEFQPQHCGIPVTGWEAHPLQTPDDARTSLLSNMDSDSISDIEDDDISDEAPPLFLHLTCTIHAKGSSGSCTVTTLPTCISELMECLENPDADINVSGLQVTLDVFCLTLPPTVEFVTSEKTLTEMRSTSFCSSSPVPTDGTNSPVRSTHSSLTSNHQYVSGSAADFLQHLPDYQHKAVATSVEEIEWLLRDWRATFLLDVFPIREETLEFVAKHVGSSLGRSSCLLEKVPLQFVFGPSQSLERFIQEFSNLAVSGYHLIQLGQFYYLVKNKTRSSRRNSSLIPTVGNKVSYQPHMTDCAELYAEPRERLMDRESSAENGIPESVTNTTMETLASEDNISAVKSLWKIQDISSRRKTQLEDSDSDEDSECQKQRRKEKKTAQSKGKVEQWACSAAAEHETLSLSASPSLPLTGQDNENRPNSSVVRSQSCEVVQCGGEELNQDAEAESVIPPLNYLQWSKKQLASEYRSEVSSLVESGQGTEDGYEGDSSDSADECDWLQDMETRRPSLPNFWLIMKVNEDAVITYFHCRFNEMENDKVRAYRDVQRNMIKNIKDLCKLVNQTMLLQNLHDTRMCDQLLEPETSEDIWPSSAELSQSSSHPVSRLKSTDDGTDNEYQSNYLDATTKFMPGWFACNVVWETYFSLHPRLKTGPGKPALSRGIQALRSVLNRFSVNNRKNMFVYQDHTGNVFYLRLHENVHLSCKLGLTGPPKSDTDDNSPGPVSRSSSLTSLNISTRKQPSFVSEDGLSSQAEELARRKSFGERDAPAVPNGSGSNDATPQPPAVKPDDVIFLKVHGISEAGPEIKEELIQVLQNRLDDAILEVLSVMLARNPMCKLTPEDVHFIQKPYKYPESIVKFSVPKHALQHIQALEYYLRQNILQFLYTPKYTDPRPEYHFQDYSQPETSEKRVPETDIFLYNQSPASGNKGIACIAIAVVDHSGFLLHHSRYPKPSRDAYSQEVNPEDFDPLTSVLPSYEENSDDSEEMAFMEFRIWKQGRVNIESLTLKIKSSVRHALWDLLTEYHLLTAPFTVPLTSAVNLKTVSTVERQSSLPDEDAVAEEMSTKMPMKEDDTAVAGDLLNEYESGESGILHKMYASVINEWLEFAVQIGVPAVKRFCVTLTSRHSLSVTVKELKNLVVLNAQDTTALVFNRVTNEHQLEEEEDVFVPVSVSDSDIHDQPRTDSKSLIVGRNLAQWKACLTDDGVFDNDVLDPKAQKGFQKFPPLLELVEENTCFVPRQRFLFAVLNELQMIVYTYNWSKDRVENLNKQVHLLGQWLSARSGLLTCLTAQKLGLFHNQEVARKRHTGLHPQSMNIYMSHMTEVEQLIKFSPTSALLKDLPSRRQMSSTHSLNAVTRNVFRDSKVSRQPFKNSSTSDPVFHIIQQMMEARNMDKREDQKKLYIMWQTRGATPNIPLDEDIIDVFKSHSRVIHYCLTPLLFLPRWRIQAAATRDHLLSLSTSGTSPVLNVEDSPDHSQKNNSPASTAKDTEDSSSICSETSSRRSVEEKWHSTLCANFVLEYKQYLQTLGFITIQTKPAAVKKSHKRSQKKKDDDDGKKSLQNLSPTELVERGVWYLQKSLLGGILLFEISFCEPFLLAKLHALECSRLQSKTSSALISQFTLSFLDECDKIKILMHLHSFTYDYHLRSIAGYVSGRQALLRQGYHLTHFLEDFMKYYSKAPNFARNLVYADVLDVEDLTTPARQLFNYLLSHEKQYRMEVFRMDNEYVLVQLENTPHITYKDAHDVKRTDDFDITLIVSHNSFLYDQAEKSIEESTLRLKYYIILTSRRELYPKLEIERKLGKFCTVSTATHEQPQQPLPDDQCSDKNASDSETVHSGLESSTSSEHTKDISVPTQTQIRQESVNYLGYYSSHEQLMQQLILEQASTSCNRIKSMVAKGMVDCRTHLLWDKLQCSPKDTKELTYSEFCELCELAVTEPLSHLDPRLGPLLCQPITWYENLARTLLYKYSEHSRHFEAPDGSTQHIVILHPRYLEAFMMLSIDFLTSRGNLCIVYRKPQEGGHAANQLEFCQDDIRSLVEGFVNACCFRLWIGLL
ncbi:KICSTOR complex protein SZT2-like [Schistocerca nitens]|uniref:KICSTOR complex protein SZT2-like n=1 Tax=Schistocerca nitens TaxID=7011 RepID=UPI0021183708|nr:KICSTOR complex protein SZT2-like [Schistocerca nitens]